MMKEMILPRVAIGIDALDGLEEQIRIYGRKVALIHGKKAYEASSDLVLDALKNVTVSENIWYGENVTQTAISRLTQSKGVQEADVLIALGGGKCIDTVKMVGEICHKPVISIATIASTCAAVTKISILYNEDGSFKEVYHLKAAPVYTFIPTGIIANAPDRYFWAGMGDAMAKHVESIFSARNDQPDFSSLYGLTVSSLCFDPILKCGKQALDDCKAHRVSDAFETVCMSIIVATGSVSLSVNPAYNSALAHALFYGLTCREVVEKNHLHGEIVSYGTLVQLMMDEQYDTLKTLYAFHQSIGLPTKLKDLELDINEPLEDVLHLTEINSELEYVPYPVKRDMIYTAMEKLEKYNGE